MQNSRKRRDVGRVENCRTTTLPLCDSHPRRLPDEIVKEILSHAPGLVVSQDDFLSTTGQHSPFADPSHISTSTVLVVCKQWLRVATPMVYHTVILRSKAQAEALYRVLSNKRSKTLGLCVRWIRLEGHYGVMMEKIFCAAPNLTNLAITLATWKSENPIGLINALPRLNLATLVVFIDAQPDRPYRDVRLGARSQKLVECLCEYIKISTSLNFFKFPDRLRDRTMLNQFSEALSKAPNLHTIFGSIDCEGLMETELRKIAENSSLRRVELSRYNSACYFWRTMPSESFWPLLQYDGKTIDQIQAEEESSRLRAASIIPVDASTKFSDRIWSCIFGFYAELPTDDPINRFDGAIASWSRSTLDMILVCKTFHRLGLKCLYHTVVIRSGPSLIRLAERILNQRSLIAHVKCVRVVLDAKSPTGEFRNDPAGRLLVQQLLTQTRLVSFGERTRSHYGGTAASFKIPWEVFRAVCENSSSSLEILRPVLITDIPRHPHLFAMTLGNLQNLRVLSWRSLDNTIFDLSNVGVSVLKNLEELEYEDTACSLPSLLSAMARIQLPSLRKVVLPANQPFRDDTHAFLISHGKKILDLSLFSLNLVENRSPLEFCPNLATLTVEDLTQGLNENLFKQFFTCSYQHQSLIKIVMKFVDPEIRFPNQFARLRPRLDYLYNPSSYSAFPDLREIQMPECCKWPTSEREIQTTKDRWPGYAESLLKGNIALTDENGKRWTPRLQPVGKKS